MCDFHLSYISKSCEIKILDHSFRNFELLLCAKVVLAIGDVIMTIFTRMELIRVNIIKTNTCIYTVQWNLHVSPFIIIKSSEISTGLPPLYINIIYTGIYVNVLLTNGNVNIMLWYEMCYNTCGCAQTRLFRLCQRKHGVRVCQIENYSRNRGCYWKIKIAFTKVGICFSSS